MKHWRSTQKACLVFVVLLMLFSVHVGFSAKAGSIQYVERPYDLFVSHVNATSVKLSWSEVPGVAGYAVFRSSNNDGTFKAIAWTTKTAYTNGGLTAGTLYHYKIKAYMLDGTTKIYSDFGYAVSIVPFARPTVKSTVSTSSSIQISWSPVSGAEGYEISRRHYSDYDYYMFTSTDSTKYLDSDVWTGTIVSYQIKPYKTIEGSRHYGPALTTKYAAVLGKPALNSVNAVGSTSIRLTWSTVDQASGYVVYRSTNPSGPFNAIAWPSGTSYTNGGLSAGVIYYYKVGAYLIDSFWNSAKFYGSLSEVKSTITLARPAITSALAVTDTSIRLSWPTVAGADGYQVSRGSSITGPFTAIAWPSTNLYVNGGLATGNLYFYKVRAYKTINGVKQYGEFSTAKSAVALTQPKSISAVASSGTSIRLSWSPVTSAEGYTVYRSATPGGPYTALTWIAGNRFTNHALTTGSLYYYKVKAYKTFNSTKYYSDFSSEVKAVALARPVLTETIAKSSSSMQISWVPVEGANGYAVYRSTTLNGSYKAIAWTENTNYVNGGLVTGSRYFYKVRAYTTTGAYKNYSDFSSARNNVVLGSPRQTRASSSGTNSVVIKWETVTGADGYVVTRSYEENGLYTPIAWVKGLEYNHAGIRASDYIYYKVKAYKNIGGVKYYGDLGNQAVASLPLTILSVTLQSDNFSVGQDIYVIVVTNGGVGEKQLKGTLYRNNVNYGESDYDIVSGLYFSVPQAGSYSMKVFVRDETGVERSKNSSSVFIGSGSLDYNLSDGNEFFEVSDNTYVTLTAGIDTGPYSFEYTLYLKDSEGTTLGEFTNSKPLRITLPAGGYKVDYLYGDRVARLVANVRTGLTEVNVNVARWGSHQINLVGNAYPLAWSSSNTAVATVSSQGLVKGVKNGTAIISCRASNGITYKSTVTVVNGVVASNISVYDDYIYNDCYITVTNFTDKVVDYYELIIDQYDGRGRKLKSPYSYYYSNDNISSGNYDRSKFWVNEHAATCYARLVYVKFTDGTVWRP